MPIPIYWKDPADKADYGFDWIDELEGDTIASSSWTPVPAGITVVDDTIFDTHTTTVWLEDGTPGVEYRVTNAITTAGSREFERSIIVVVTDL